MKYNIEQKEYNLDINIDDMSGNRDKLLEAFQECQQGRCSCPTEEYKKLDSLEIEYNEEGIQLHLKSKNGVKFDKNKINKCLEYTAKRINKE